PVPVVTYHCTRCHSEASASDRIMSANPDDRRLAGHRARQHMRPGACRGAEVTARGDRMVAAVEEHVWGTAGRREQAGLYAAWCQDHELRPEDFSSASSCAEVRAARTHTARHG
ncbi:MAG TPA: hypothetical protein VK586_08470, partial [Streptosporangiaceae bacterium]|nr:hypothetical protein [Streptosporangiaceae bacterium]